MPETTTNYFPLLFLLLIPLLIVNNSHDHSNDLLTDEQKLQKQKENLEKQKQIDEDFNNSINVIFSKNNPFIFLPPLILIAITFKIWSWRYRNPKYFLLIGVCFVLYCLWLFGDGTFDFTFSSMNFKTLFPNLSNSTIIKP